jgi:uncharacterized membrane protein YkvA (DUF1232 family)
VIPDFLPAIGHLDDAVVVAFALRTIIRSAGPEVVREQWPGSPEALSLVLRLAG